MKNGLTRFQVLLSVVISFFLFVSVAYGGQAVKGIKSQDGKPTDWDSPVHNGQDHISPAQSGTVKQDPGAAGGGEGRPTDWDSPHEFPYFGPLDYRTHVQTIRVSLRPAVLNLILWWF